MELYLFRHGETDINRQNRIQGQLDTHGLNDTGLAQANTLASYLVQSGITFDTVFSSPLRRARETASAIASVQNLDIMMDAGLLEIGCGDLEGVEISEARAHAFDPPLTFINPVTGQIITIAEGAILRDLIANADPSYDLICHPNGETKAAARDRFTVTVDRISKSISTRIGIVAHSKIISLFLERVPRAPANIKLGCCEGICISVSLGVSPVYRFERLIQPGR